MVSNSEHILNKLDIKANPKRLQVKKHADEYEADTEADKEGMKGMSKVNT